MWYQHPASKRRPLRSRSNAGLAATSYPTCLLNQAWRAMSCPESVTRKHTVNQVYFYTINTMKCQQLFSIEKLLLRCHKLLKNSKIYNHKYSKFKKFKILKFQNIRSFRVWNLGIELCVYVKTKCYSPYLWKNYGSLNYVVHSS